MKKRILALALCLLMVLSLLPMQAMASNYDFLREAIDYLLVHDDDISEQLTNDTDEADLARIIQAELKKVLPDTEITVTTTIYNWGDVVRKNATTTERGFFTAQFILTLDGDSQDWTHSFYIPVAEEKQSEIDLMAADKAAIAAAFAGYFATAKIDDTNILQQKKTLQGLMDNAAKYCSEAKFLNGGEGFSTSVKNGYIRGAYLLVLGGQREEIKLDVTLRADGSATMNSPTLGGASVTAEPEVPAGPAAVYMDDPRCVNVSAAQAEKMYQDGERFVLIVCTSTCGWCNQMKKVFPSALSAADYGIYAVIDDVGDLSFYWKFVWGNTLGTPLAVLVNGKNDVEVVSSVRSQEEMADVLQKAKKAGIPSATGTTQAAPTTYTGRPTNDKLSVDGQPKAPTAYKINGSNYFQLRDVALLLNGTKAQFSVDYDATRKAVVITTGQPYAPNGTEGKAAVGDVQAIVGNNDVYINGAKADFTVYKINGSNYFKIRDLGKALGFNVDWTQEKGMFIESDKPYSGT